MTAVSDQKTLLQGALGLGDTEDVYEPDAQAALKLPATVSKLVAGHFHSLAITKEGELWGWG